MRGLNIAKWQNTRTQFVILLSQWLRLVAGLNFTTYLVINMEMRMNLFKMTFNSQTTSKAQCLINVNLSTNFFLDWSLLRMLRIRDSVYLIY